MTDGAREYSADELQQLVEETFVELQGRRGEGKVADYIPALAEVDPNHFGIALATPDGRPIPRKCCGLAPIGSRPGCC